MFFLGAIASFMGLLMARGFNVVELCNEVFSSFVAVTGDAHQAKVAQDIFRQQIRYQRSLQIREDIRDVNKLMMESVQTHTMMGSIILGVCFTMAIEGMPPLESDRTMVALWLVFTCWSVTFTLIALWLALNFQMKISLGARERLLHRHRFAVPDDLVVGKMGGHNLVNQVAGFHGTVLTSINNMVNANADQEADAAEKNERVWPNRVTAKLTQLTVPVDGPLNGRDFDDGSLPLDAEPLRKGLYAWLHPSGHGCVAQSVLDVPFFLVGETLVRNPWQCGAKGPGLRRFRVRGDATLYISGQILTGSAADDITKSSAADDITKSTSPRKDKVSKEVEDEPAVGDSTFKADVRKAFWLEGAVPAWPPEELPLVTAGFHEKWRGDSGFGEFRRVEGFSIYVTSSAQELPVYKIVLANPADRGKDYVDVELTWNFNKGCEAMLLVLRRGQIHCREEDWPLAEFNEEMKKVMLLRHYSGLYLRQGLCCLVLAASLMLVGRLYVLLSVFPLWWFEFLMAAIALIPALLAIGFVPVEIARTEAALSMQAINKVQYSSVGLGITRMIGLQRGDNDEFSKKSEQGSRAGSKEKPILPVKPTNGFAETTSPLSMPTPSHMVVKRAAVGSCEQDGQRARTERSNPFNLPDDRRLQASTVKRSDDGSPSKVVAPEGDGIGPLPKDPQWLKPRTPELPVLSSRAAVVAQTSHEPPMIPVMPGSGSCCKVMLSPTRSVVVTNPYPQAAAASSRAASPAPAPPTKSLPAASNVLSLQRCADIEVNGVEYPMQTIRIDTKSPPQYESQSSRREQEIQVAVKSRMTRTGSFASEEEASNYSFEVNDVPVKKPLSRGTGSHCDEEDETRGPPTLRERLQDQWELTMVEARTPAFWTRLLQVIFASSVMSVLVMPFWSQMDSSKMGSNVEPTAVSASSEHGVIGLTRKDPTWTAWNVPWPPLVKPTAAALDLNDGSLWIVGGSVLRKFDVSESFAPAASSSAFVLPGHSSGLVSIADSNLLAFGEYGAAFVNVSYSSLAGGASSSVGSVSTATSSLGLLGAVGVVSVGPSFALPLALEELTTAAALRLTQASASVDDTVVAVFVALRGEGISLCRISTATSSVGGSGQLEVLAPLEPLGLTSPLVDVRGLHACAAGQCAEEPVLWVALADGSVAAVGLASGRALGIYERPTGQADIVALTGNSSHLVAVLAPKVGVAAMVFSTPYPALPADSAVGEQR